MKATTNKKRFSNATEDEIKERKNNNINRKNILKSDKTAARILKDYLVEKDMDADFENLNKNHLNDRKEGKGSIIDH